MKQELPAKVVTSSYKNFYLKGLFFHVVIWLLYA